MMNWSLLFLGLVAVSNLAWADNSYLVVVPKLLKTGSDNQVSIFIGAASQPVDVKFELIVGQLRIENRTTCNAGETRNATLALPSDWPVGAGELHVIGTGGVQFEERRDVIIYDDRHVILVQTSSSNYYPGDTLEVRVVATNENLIPIENGEVTIKIYDATLKMVAEYPRFPIRTGLTETIRFPLYEHVNMGTWLVSATIGNTTSSVHVLVARPVTPSFDLKAIFQRFFLRTDKTLRGFIEINCDQGNPIFGRATIAVGQMTEQTKPEQNEEYRNWKSQTMEIAGRVELNYDLESLFNIDISKALAVQIYIEVTDLTSGQQRVVRHLIPVFTGEVIYDIRPLGFEAGVKNEFEIVSKRPDGKPTKMEELIVNVRMLFADQKQEKTIEIKDFYTRGRNDIGLFNFDIPKDCMGVLISLTPLGTDGKQRGYRTRAIPLMPLPSRRNNGAKLSIELAPASKNVDGSVVSTQIATVGQMANFYIQLLPLKSVEKFEPLAMSYILLTNGKISLTGQFTVEPTKACQTQTPRTIQPELQAPPACVLNGTLSFPVTRKMVPYSTLLVYTFQPSFGFNVAESYRFSVAGLFQSKLALNATVVSSPATTNSINQKLKNENTESSEEIINSAFVSNKAQDKSQVELSFTTSPESIVGLNVIEYDAMLQGLPNEITKERLLRYLTRYEQLPINGMPTTMSNKNSLLPRELQMLDERSLNEQDEEEVEQNRRNFKVKLGPVSVNDKGLSVKTPIGQAKLNTQGATLNTRVGNVNLNTHGATFTNDLGSVGVDPSGKVSGHVGVGGANTNFKTTIPGVKTQSRANSRNGGRHPRSYANLGNEQSEDKLNPKDKKVKSIPTNTDDSTQINTKPSSDSQSAPESVPTDVSQTNEETTPAVDSTNASDDSQQTSITRRGLEELQDDEQINQEVRALDEDEETNSEDVRSFEQIEDDGQLGLDAPKNKGDVQITTVDGTNIKIRPGSSGSAQIRTDESGTTVQLTGSAFESRNLNELENDEQTNQEERESDDNERDERFFRDETEEMQQFRRERLGRKVRYPIEKMIFGIESMRRLPLVAGDDVYLPSSMGRFYDNNRNQESSSYYHRKDMKQVGQYDVTVDNNDYTIATSIPRVLTGNQQHFDKDEQEEERSRFGSSAWYAKMNSKLNSISKEGFLFLHSGLSIISDFDSLRIPTDLQRTNLKSTMNKFRSHLIDNDRDSFDIRDDARQLLEEYMTDFDVSMIPPPMMIEERTRNNYYRSIFFNSSHVDAQGTGKVVIPRMKPYSTWLATGFALNPKSGLTVAQPIRLPHNQGLFILGNFPQQVQIGEQALLTCGINNYLGKTLHTIIVTIRASPDFDIFEETQPGRMISVRGIDYTWTIPSLKAFGVETRNLIIVPKRAGVIKILLEVDSKYGGDSELLISHVREAGIKRRQYSAHLYDLTGNKKTFGPFNEMISQSPFLRTVKLTVSGTGLDRFVDRYAMEKNSMIGVDRALIRLYRSLGLRRYLNATSQRDSSLFNMTFANISTAYQKLQLYANYNGSYSFISDQGRQSSSLYLSSLAFGAMISPLMPFHDNVTLNRTLNYILSRQQPDGSFEENGPCLHKHFCSGPYHREAMTALVLYSFTHHNVSLFMPEFIRRQLFSGEQSPIQRAQRFLESHIPTIKPCLLTSVFVEMTLLQCNCISEQFYQRLRQTVLDRQLTVVPEDESKYFKISEEKFTLDDQLLINAMTLSIYARFGDFKTTSAMARYIVSQLKSHQHSDTLIGAIFGTQAWLSTDYSFRREFSSDKFSITVDIAANNGQKKQLKIDGRNMDISQTFTFKLPVETVTYSISGFGLVNVCLKQVFVEQAPTTTSQVSPFQLTQEFSSMPWLGEIEAKTCVNYVPTPDQSQVKKNNTIVLEVRLPSGMRINLRQIGFFVGKTPEVMHFTYSHHHNKLNFFLNVPWWTNADKLICFNWVLERLSQVINYAPIEVRAYDYVKPEVTLSRLINVQVQPAPLGYSFVDAVLKARPSLKTSPIMQRPKPQYPKYFDIRPSPSSHGYRPVRPSPKHKRPTCSFCGKTKAICPIMIC